MNTQGKKFSAVDKSWRQTISSAKTQTLAISFCDSDKLLDRFREAAVLLEQVSFAHVNACT